MWVVYVNMHSEGDSCFEGCVSACGCLIILCLLLLLLLFLRPNFAKCLALGRSVLGS